MKMIDQTTRRKVIRAGGIIIASSAVGGAANLFAKEAEKKNEEVSPPEDLMREHGVLKRIMLVYGEALRRIDANEDLPPEPLAESAKIITKSWRRTFCSRVLERRTSLSILSTCFCSSIRPVDV